MDVNKKLSLEEKSEKAVWLRTPDTTYTSPLASTAEQQSPRGGDVGTICC
jgi:hypothetical protein